MNRRLVAAIVLVPFLAFSSWVAITHGALGFLTVAGREPWALQMLLDLVIASAFAVHWMVRDARASGRNPWPWIAGTVALGSISPLLYIVTGGPKRR